MGDVVDLTRRTVGSGDPMVLVHGVAADAEAFRLLEPHLARHFTVVTVDRRGRRGSADGAEYSLEGEFDDLARVLDSLPSPVTVFGHSFGGNIALGAALRGANVARLVLYEPGRRGDPSAEVRDEVLRLLEADDRRGAMRLVLLEFTRFPEEWLDDLLDTPPWQERLGYAHTVGRELRAYEEHDHGDLSRLTLPTLLLVGSESPPRKLAHAEALSRILPSARVTVLDGQGHVGIVTAPELVAAEVVAFAQSER
jgi:pimeloyl-ACP methyl ester carboxylesterase